MKKYFSALPIIVMSLVIFFTLPASTQARFVCPVGYTCTPVQQTVPNCPNGYVCTWTNTTSSLTNPPQVTPISCTSLSRNLGIGTILTMQEANILSRALIAEGVWTSTDEIGANNNPGTYNQTIAAAITRLQEKYASEILRPNGLNSGTGFLGSSTRAKINALYKVCEGINQNPPKVIPVPPPSTSTPSVVVCSAGYTCVPTPGTPAIGICPANYTCTLTNSQVSVTVLYPNGRETLEAGKTYSLERRVTNFPSNGKLIVALEDDATLNTYLDAGDITNVSFPTITIPSNIKPGRYKVRLFCGVQNSERYCSADGTLATNSSAQDYSDKYFTITAPVSNQQSSITVTSPNGGETFAAGQPFTVTWVGSNFPSNGRVTIALQDSRTINTYLAEGLSNSGSATLTIPASIEPGAYTVRVVCGLQDSDAYCNSTPKSEDYSNASFGITSTQGSPSPTPVSGAPVITSIVGPSGFWANNSVGIWTTYVSDVNVGSITASVDWGDGSLITHGGNMGDGSVRFAHQYTQPGTYTLTFTVRNQNGLTGQKTTTVQVW